jgi:nucleoside-diphosphate-sugar epimerase
VLKGQTIAVTGGGGFIGSTVVRALAQEGAAIRTLLGPPGQAVQEAPRGVSAVRGDVGDLATLLSLADGAGAVIHLAGPPGVAVSFEQPALYARVHVEGTVNVLEACRRAGVRRLIHVSSAEVYGRPRRNPVAEDHPLEARSPYAAAKIGAERFVEAFAHAHGLQAVLLRPFSVYGPGLAPGSLIGTLFRQARAGQAVVLADLEPVRDYCYLGDVVRGILRACAAPLPPLCTFNLGSGKGVSVAELAQAVLDVMGRDLPVCADPARRRPGAAEIRHLVADSTRAARVLGWTADTPLREGLRHTLAWLERQ